MTGGKTLVREEMLGFHVELLKLEFISTILSDWRTMAAWPNG